ncbi:MAG: hypothetical protein NC117_08300 [Pseudoflavonifractor sp.]|nr:hypothetical protein [Pseudoflavonifractor sp.]
MFGLFKKKEQPASLFFSTDIHCHILPGIDDGSPDVTTSAELVERMKSWGISRIIASPHVTMETFENTPATIRPALESLKAELASRGVDLDLSHSAEYRIDEFFTRQLDEGNVIPLPNNYLLVENSFIQEPWGLDQFLFDLKVKGYRPILAHPERYHYYHSHRDRYDNLHSTGTLFQINLLSLAGYYGSAERNVANKLVENGLVDFIGTDLHNHRHADYIESYLKSKDYRRLLSSGLTLLNDTL